MFNHVAPYGYLLPTVYLFMADMANLFVFVGPGFVSTSPAFMRCSSSHPAGPHGGLPEKRKIRPPMLGADGLDTICTAVCDRCGNSTTCRLYRLEAHAWDAVLNSSKYYILARIQIIQLYKFVCTIPTQNIKINLHSKLPFSRLFRHTWVKAVM